MNYKILSRKITKTLKRVFCFIVALIFLIEAWLWEHLYPVVARLVAWLPWDNVKAWVAKRIQHLPASICVFVFIIPVIAILPIKILGVWLMSEHHIFSGVLVFLTAKLVGLGVAAFLFETCKEKLLSLRWFLWVYNTVLKIKKWATAQVAPAMQEIRHLKSIIMGNSGSLSLLLKKIRKDVLYRAKK